MKRCKFCDSPCETGICEACLYIENDPGIQLNDQNSLFWRMINDQNSLIRELEIEIEAIHIAIEQCLFRAQAKRLKRVLREKCKELKKLKK